MPLDGTHGCNRAERKRGMPVTKLPAIQFYPGDWLRDPVAACSLAAQGLWLRMMFIGHDSERYGYLCQNGEPIPAGSIARRCGCTPKQYSSLLSELDEAAVPSRTPEGIIYSRRMVRDALKRQKAAERQQKHRERNADVTLDVTLSSHPSSSSSSSSTSVSDAGPVTLGGTARNGDSTDDAARKEMRKILADLQVSEICGTTQQHQILSLIERFGPAKTLRACRDAVKRCDKKTKFPWYAEKTLVEQHEEASKFKPKPAGRAVREDI